MLTLDRRQRRGFLILSALIALLGQGTAGGAVAGLTTPALAGRVTDLARVFPAEQLQRLSDGLAAHEEATTQQIAVLTVPTLSGESIEAFSLRVANTWALGKKGVDNGVLVTLALQEHRVRIELGRGLESKIPQQTLDGIIQNDMVPAFKKGDFAGGLEKGVRHLIEVAAPSPTGHLECDVDIRVNQVEKKAAVTEELAQELGLGKEAIGKLGLAMLAATSMGAKPNQGGNAIGCSKLVGTEGHLVLRYELKDPRAETLVAGRVIRLHLMALEGFAPYGVPGTVSWTFPR